MFYRAIAQFRPLVAASLAVVAAGCGTTPASPSREANDPVQEAVGVQELRQEVAELHDAIEVQRNELRKLRERQRQLYDDLDHRLRQTEQAAVPGQYQSTGSGQQGGYGQGAGQQDSGEGAQQGYGGSDADGQQTAGPGQQSGQTGGQQGDESGQLAAYGEQSGESQGTRQGTGEGTTQQGGRQQAAVASTEEQAAYDSAFELLKQSRYNDAIIDFRSLIAQFPNGALVDDAQYWIGEAYYVTRDFQNALGAFQAVVNQYPDSQRVPEALLKLGYVQAELGQTEQARQTLNQVISQYPGSRVAISAETRLSKIQ